MKVTHHPRALLLLALIFLTIPTISLAGSKDGAHSKKAIRSTLVVPLLDNVEEVDKTRSMKPMEVEQSTLLNGVLHHYHARSRSDRLVGQVFVFRDFGHEWTQLSWDFSKLSHLRIEVRTRTNEEVITITPVVFAGSEPYPDSTKAPMPESLSNVLNLIRESEEIVLLLPRTISSLIEDKNQSDYRYSGSADNPTLNNETEWGCGLACGGVIGAGMLTAVSGGTLGPGLVLGAATCGSCMGFIWGSPPTAQGPIILGPGTEGHAGSIFPPLPPGWMWACTQTAYGRHSCQPVELSLD